MSFYSDASLVLIPSGYKDQKVYSAVPTDGSGDLSFTRASSATRVQSNGLIEKVRTNEILQSQTFDNASWIKLNATATENSTTAPDGTLTADTILAPLASYCGVYQTISSEGAITLSLYAKANTSNFIAVTIFDASPAVDYTAIFDLSNGTFVGNGGFSNVDSYSIENAGNGWYRLSVTKNVGAVGNHNYVIGVAKTGNSLIPVAGTSVFVWGAQVEASDFGATPYIPTTTAAVSVGPVSGLPRLDYLGSTCPRLLLEPQRTNLLQYSEQLNNAYWTPDGGTITANTAVAPDGTTSMDRLTETATTNPHQVISSTVTIFGGAARTFSVFVKKGNVRYIQIANVAFGASSASAIFDLDTKTVTDNRASSGAGPAFSFVSASVEDYGNGILRLILVNTCSFDSPTYRIANSNQATFTGATLVDGMVSYAGNASSFTDIWGCQLESASYATSYIPTLGASVTRVADAALKTGISSLIGQTEGAFMIDVNLDTRVSFTYFALAPDLALASNYLGIALNASSIVFEVVSGSVLQAGITLSNSATGRFKIAVAYKANDFVMYVNGTQVGTDSSGSVPTCSQVGLYAYDQTPSVKYNQALLFTTRLTNESLASLTSL